MTNPGVFLLFGGVFPPLLYSAVFALMLQLNVGLSVT
jgi:hypothetical protein